MLHGHNIELLYANKIKLLNVLSLDHVTVSGAVSFVHAGPSSQSELNTNMNTSALSSLDSL